jgi:hypothetical protein
VLSQLGRITTAVAAALPASKAETGFTTGPHSSRSDSCRLATDSPSSVDVARDDDETYNAGNGGGIGLSPEQLSAVQLQLRRNKQQPTKLDTDKRHPSRSSRTAITVAMANGGESVTKKPRAANGPVSREGGGGGGPDDRGSYASSRQTHGGRLQDKVRRVLGHGEGNLMPGLRLLRWVALIIALLTVGLGIGLGVFVINALEQYARTLESVSTASLALTSVINIERGLRSRYLCHLRE